jgi:hypothetical protein
MMLLRCYLLLEWLGEVDEDECWGIGGFLLMRNASLREEFILFCCCYVENMFIIKTYFYQNFLEENTLLLLFYFVFGNILFVLLMLIWCFFYLSYLYKYSISANLFLYYEINKSL